MTADILSQTRTQNPLSGALETVMSTERSAAPCLARNAVSGSAITGSAERFGGVYENIDWVSLTIPSNIDVSKRHFVTNIKDSSGELVWEEEDGSATLFDVQGVIPQIDPFGKHIETKLILQRAEVQ